VLWTTTYLADTIDALRADGIKVSDESVAHLTPAQHDHINFYLDMLGVAALQRGVRVV